MKPRESKEKFYWVGAVDWDRRLFDELIPLPDGTSYNAYLVKGSEKTALRALAKRNRQKSSGKAGKETSKRPHQEVIPLLFF